MSAAAARFPLHRNGHWLTVGYAARVTFANFTARFGSPKDTLATEVPQTALSRLWCAFFGVAATSACISPPQTYEETQQIPPFVIVEKTTPPPWVFKRLASGESQDFHVPFYSEDVGVRVQALVYVDALPGDSRQEAESRTGDATDDSAPDAVEDAPPGSFDVERSINFTIPEFNPGCHAVSALLTHASNFDPDNRNTILNKSLVARVVWWFDVQGGLQTEVMDCPTLGIEPLQPE